MEYYISNKIFFDTYNLNNHYIGWCLIGNYYIGNRKILNNKLVENNYIDVANIGAVSVPEKNFISIDGNSVIFKNSDNLRIVGNDANSGVKTEDCLLLLLDYGTEPVDIEQKITDAMGADFQDEALLEENKDIEHIYFNDVSNILYKQKINDSEKIINLKNYTKIVVGKLKVNLEGLEN